MQQVRPSIWALLSKKARLKTKAANCLAYRRESGIGVWRSRISWVHWRQNIQRGKRLPQSIFSGVFFPPPVSSSSLRFIPSAGKEVRKLLISFYGGKSSPWTLIQSRFRAILMKINMPAVGVVAYDFDFCRHFRFGLATNEMLKNNTCRFQKYIHNYGNVFP